MLPVCSPARLPLDEIDASLRGERAPTPKRDGEGTR